MRPDVPEGAALPPPGDSENGPPSKIEVRNNTQAPSQSRPSTCSRYHAAMPGSRRWVKKTTVGAVAASTIRSAAATSSATGFSSSSALPASAARGASSDCTSGGTEKATASTASSSRAKSSTAFAPWRSASAARLGGVAAPDGDEFGVGMRVDPGGMRGVGPVTGPDQPEAQHRPTLRRLGLSRAVRCGPRSACTVPPARRRERRHWPEPHRHSAPARARG